MKILTSQVGKYLFLIPFIIFGIFHFISGQQMAALVPSFIPGGVIWVYLTGVALIAAPVGVFIGKYAKLAMFLLGVMLLIFVLTIHLPGVAGGNEQSMPSLLKDLALAGAAWMYADGLSD